MRRAILICPKTEGIASIEKVRSSFDPLFGATPPHVTLVFPFMSKLSSNLLLEHTIVAVAIAKPFRLSFGPPEAHIDGYVWLPVITGENTVAKLHDQLYTGILEGFLSKSHAYIPHLTVAHVSDDRVQTALFAAERRLGNLVGWVDRVEIVKILDDRSLEIQSTVWLTG